MQRCVAWLFCSLLGSPVLSTASAEEFSIIEFGERWEWLHPTDGIDPAESTGDEDFQSTWYRSDYTGPAFNASGAGVYGYGELDWVNEALETKLIGEFDIPESGKRYTAYFRKRFTLAEPATNLALEVFADDAAIVYIDGTEVGRFNIDGTDDYKKLALSNNRNETSDTERSPRPVSLSTNDLPPGQHLIAVSVHNASPGPAPGQRAWPSPDLGFDLRLTAFGEPELPIIRVDKTATGSANGASWKDAYPSLRDAIAKAEPGSEIWVSAGVYYPDEGTGIEDDDEQESFLLKEGVAIYGGFAGVETTRVQRDIVANPTILSGDIGQDDLNEDGNFVAETPFSIVRDQYNSWQVVEAYRVSRNAILDGFTITAGFANGAHQIDDGGAGLRCIEASPSIYNCVFSGNFSAWQGGAVQIRGISTPLFRNCAFYGNQAERGGAISVEEHSFPELVECDLSKNVVRDDGGAIFNIFSITSLTNCRLSGNSARTGGAYYATSAPSSSTDEIVNCVFTGNTAQDSGGAIYLTEASMTLSHCTLTGNQSREGSGGAIYHRDEGKSTLRNCIVWENAASRSTATPDASIVAFDDNAGSIIQNSVIANSGGSGANWNPAIGVDLGGNIDTDPVFSLPVSPAEAPTTMGIVMPLASLIIDAGERSLLPADTFDLNEDGDVSEPIPVDYLGNPRIVGDSSDPGAIEHFGPAVLSPIAPLRFPLNSPPQPAAVVLSDVFDDSVNAYEISSITPGGIVNASVDSSDSALSLEFLPDVIGKVTIGIRAMNQAGEAATYEFQVSVVAPVLYVNHAALGAYTGVSWTNAFNSLQDALTAAGTNTEIWVAKGVYYPDQGAGIIDNDADAFFELRNGVELYGGFAGNESARESRDPSINTTILSGDLLQDDLNEDGNSVAEVHDMIRGVNSRLLIEASFTDETIVLDGFEITAAEGSAMRCRLGSPSVENCTFSGVAGAISLQESSLSLSHCAFVGNSAGAIVSDRSELLLIDCRFAKNSSNAIQSEDSSLVLSNCAFTDHSASAIDCTSGSLSVTDCDFRGNSSSNGDGGALYLEHTAGDIVRSSFSDNTARDDGGAICLTRSSPTVVQCTFGGNRSEGDDGGALCLRDKSSPTILRCDFSRNTAGSQGGAIYTGEQCAPHVADCVFIENAAESDGGAICGNPFSTPIFKQCRFVSNSCVFNGGAIFFDRSSPEFVDCAFDNNSADMNGGALYLKESMASLANCTIAGNSAGSGGGLYIRQASPGVFNTLVTGNFASFQGGGVYNNEGSATFTNCIISGNKSNASGGGFYISSATPTLSNSIVWNNSAQGAGASASASIFAGEGFSNGGISASIIAHSGSSGAGWDTAIGIDLGGNIDADPLFVSPISPDDAPASGGDYHGGQESPGIDAGHNAAGPPILRDLDGNPRYFGQIDIGPYEFQPALPLDSDGDGLSDAFELAFTNPPSTTDLQPNDDRDGDNLTALAESYFGTSPLIADTGVVEVNATLDGFLTVRFPETRDGLGLLTLTVESSFDLVLWNEIDVVLSVNTVKDGSTNLVTLHSTASSAPLARRQFLRLSIGKR